MIFFLILHFDFRFGQEVKVKLGLLFKKYFLTNNDLYNGVNIGQEVKVKLGSPF